MHNLCISLFGANRIEHIQNNNIDIFIILWQYHDINNSIYKYLTFIVRLLLLKIIFIIEESVNYTHCLKRRKEEKMRVLIKPRARFIPICEIIVTSSFLLLLLFSFFCMRTPGNARTSSCNAIRLNYTALTRPFHSNCYHAPLRYARV